MPTPYEVEPIGHVESPLADPATAPKQGFEGAPDAWLIFNPEVTEAARDLAVGAEVFVRDLEAVDGTPILDVKPVLAGGR
jgi:tRNA (Thr-GGU) A37 N-methylase